MTQDGRGERERERERVREREMMTRAMRRRVGTLWVRGEGGGGKMGNGKIKREREKV